MRDARAVMQVGIADPRWRGKRSRHSQRMRNPQFLRIWQVVHGMDIGRLLVFHIDQFFVSMLMVQDQIVRYVGPWYIEIQIYLPGIGFGVGISSVLMEVISFLY